MNTLITADMEQEQKTQSMGLWYVISLAWQLGFLIAVPIAGFIALGAWLDHVLDSGPLIISIGAFIGVSVTIYEVYQLLKTIIDQQRSSK